MSASAISDAIINNLSATSAIGSCQVATHYAIMERTSACCAVVSFREMESHRLAYDNQHERLYTHLIQLCVKDRSGNAELIERQIGGLIDIAVCSLESDVMLQGAENVRELVSLRVNHNPTPALEAGGAFWYASEVLVRTKEWPNN